MYGAPYQNMTRLKQRKAESRNRKRDLGSAYFKSRKEKNNPDIKLIMAIPHPDFEKKMEP